MMGFWDGSGISWTTCKQSAPRSRHITTSIPLSLNFLQVGCSSDAQPTALKAIWCKESGTLYTLQKYLHNLFTKLPELRSTENRELIFVVITVTLHVLCDITHDVFKQTCSHLSTQCHTHTHLTALFPGLPG